MRQHEQPPEERCCVGRLCKAEERLQLKYILCLFKKRQLQAEERRGVGLGVQS